MDLASEKTISDLVRAARCDGGGATCGAPCRSAWWGFETLLRADQRGPDHGAALRLRRRAGAGGGADGSGELRGGRGSVLPTSGESPQRQAGIHQVINNMRRAVERPNEKFIQALGEFEETDFSSYFPVGLRGGVAPTWLGDVYSTGVVGKEHANNYIRERQLGDNGEARELTPLMTAIDTISLQGRKSEAINTIALERLSKKGLGIVSAFRAVEVKDHWRNLANGGKT